MDVKNTSLLLDIYDLEYNFDEDIKFVLEQLRRDNKEDPNIFEIGSGTGRVLIGLLENNYKVDGVEIVKEGIELTKEKLRKKPNLRYYPNIVNQDAINLKLDKEYDYILMMFNCLMEIITLKDQEKVLRNANEYLVSGGIIIFCVSNPSLDRMSEKFPYVKHQKTLVNPKTGNKIDKYEYNEYDLENQLIHRTFYYDEIIDGIVHRKGNRFTVRYLFKYELFLLLKKSGFEIEKVYGDWQGNDLEQESPSIIVVARKI